MGRWAGRTEKALARRHDCLDTTEVESHVVEAAEELARQCPIPYAQRGASNITLEAYCKCPAPEACGLGIERELVGLGQLESSGQVARAVQCTWRGDWCNAKMQRRMRRKIR